MRIRLLLVLAAFAVRAEEPEPGPPPGAFHQVLTVSISPDGRYLAAGGAGSPPGIWDLGTGAFVRELGT